MSENPTDAKATPAGKNPATATDAAHVQSGTPENKHHKLNPSAPNDVNITPDTDYKQE